MKMSMMLQQSKRQKASKHPPRLGRIAGEHYVRLRHPGDGAGRRSANTATHLWKTYVCTDDKKIYRKENGSWDVPTYKRILKSMLSGVGIHKEPVFVLAAVRDIETGERLYEDEWFIADKPACKDILENSYFEVKDALIEEDLGTKRASGSTRKKNSSLTTQQAEPPIRSPIVFNTLPISMPWEETFTPTINGIFARKTVETMNLHKDLRAEIKAATTTADCIQVYDNPFFQECLNVFRQAQAQFIDNNPNKDGDLVEKWAKHWAKGVTHGQEWAKVIEDCRKTAFLLLKQVCDLWNFIGHEGKPEDLRVIEAFQKRRINQIMPYTLVLDRANAIYHMTLDPTATNKVRGLCWYSSYDDGARNLVDMPKNPVCASINKRYIWLYSNLYSEEDVVITNWLQIAFPPRLANQQPEHMLELTHDLREQRNLSLDEALKKVNAVWPPVLTLHASEVDESDNLSKPFDDMEIIGV